MTAVVLVVEDDLAVLSLIDQTLHSRGFEVSAVSNDDRAYHILEQAAPAIAVLVTDVNLGPGTTGFDIARRARSLNPDIGVIYCTGQEAHSEKFMVPGAVVLLKPLDVEVLASQVGALIAQGRPR